MRFFKAVSLLILMALIVLNAGCIRNAGQGRRNVLDSKSSSGRSLVDETLEEAKDIKDRPSGSMTIKSDFCSCIGGRVDIYNGCETYCLGKLADSRPIFYGEVELSREITQHGKFNNLYQWCSIQLEGEEAEPNCQLEIYNGEEKNYLAINIEAGANIFWAVLNSFDVPAGQRVEAKVVELISGVESKPIQFRRIQQSLSAPVTTGRLKTIPISQYTCLHRSWTTQRVESTNYATMPRFYFTFPSDEPPPIIKNEGLIFCHDAVQYGRQDGVMIPRLELRTNKFKLWDKSDFRFYDINLTDGILDIQKIIKDRMADEHNQNWSTELFHQFTWHGLSHSGNTNSQLMGYYMSPWTNSSTGKAFCPTRNHYATSEYKIFKVLGDLIGVDTQAIYLAKGEPQEYTNSYGTKVPLPNDIIVVQKSTLERIWFYYEGGGIHAANEEAAKSKTIRFYWPPVFVAPLTKKVYQRTYTVKSPTNISLNRTTGGLRTDIEPHDKRFGCIPK